MFDGVGAGEEEVDEAVGVRWGVDGRGRPSYGSGLTDMDVRPTYGGGGDGLRGGLRGAVAQKSDIKLLDELFMSLGDLLEI
jgi:hypothetical protein